MASATRVTASATIARFDTGLRTEPPPGSVHLPDPSAGSAQTFAPADRASAHAHPAGQGLLDGGQGDRFRDVVVHAGREAQLPVAGDGAGGHRDDRRVLDV